MMQEGLRSLTEGADFVKQVLDSSSAEMGTLKYNMAPCDLKAIVSEMSERARKNAEEKKLAFELVIDEGDFNISADAAQLKEAVRNMIDNSVIYTQTGSVKVHLSRGTGKVTMAVTDTGVGLTEEDKTRLFTKGGRGKDSQKINAQSTGFGLSFVKSVVEAHKGRVWADSPGRDKGSTFTMELPLA
jgi:signal transduction histidine kinase